MLGAVLVPPLRLLSSHFFLRRDWSDAVHFTRRHAIQGRSAFTAGDKVGNMRSWFRLLTIAFWLLLSGAAHAACPGTSLTNGTIADANDVMAWLNCKAPLDSPHFMGNAGIGTTTPSSLLTVVGSAGGSADILTKSSNASGYATLTLSNDASKALSLGMRGSSSGAFGSYANVSYIDSAGDLQLYTGGSERLRVTGAGNVGIGTTSPGYKFEVWGATANLFRMYNTTNNGGLAIFTHSVNPVIQGYSTTPETPGNLILERDGGYVGIGTTAPAQKLEVAGTIRQSGCITAGTLSVNSSGDIICSSDARLKNVHASYDAGLSAILRIDPVLFSYRPTTNNPHESFVHAGFLAQNVKAVIPQASALQRDGYYSLDTTAILAAAVNAIKELKKQNDAQAAHIQRQDTAITELKGRVDAVERRTEARTAANYH